MTPPSSVRTALLGAAALACATAVACGDGLVASAGSAGPPGASTAPAQAMRASGDRDKPELPHGGRRVFDGRILVAYYGTAGTAALGVLGEGSPKEMTERLRAAAAPFAHGNTKVQIVYELISSVADASPGADGDYSHYIADESVRRYVRVARRNKALVVLDLQPGRSDFLTQAKHFRWALRKPWVGLALDPEWRMGPHQVPARTIGSVTAAEVNRVSRYVARIRTNRDLPQKLFMLHQFRTDMIQNIGRVRSRPGLAMVQHVDGFGTRSQKLATFHNVIKPTQFHLGFKLFYDEDTRMFRPGGVLNIRPRIQFVSYQ